MIGNLLDNLASLISPKWGAQRALYRQTYQKVRNDGFHNSFQQWLGSRNAGGYEAGKADRLKGRYWFGSTHENDVPRQQINRLRWRAWNLYRNNPQARKICRTLGAKVIGRGLSPQSQASNKDGSPNVAFRKRAREVWDEFSKECDFRGKPGSGGQHMASLSKTALRATILSGGTLFRFHHLSRAEQRAANLFVPLQIQLMHVDRIDQSQHGGNKFYGVELDQEGRPTVFHILKGGIPNLIQTNLESPPC